LQRVAGGRGEAAIERKAGDRVAGLQRRTDVERFVREGD